MIQSIPLEVRGTPIPYSSQDRERKWREVIEKEAKLKRTDELEQSISASTVFTVTIQFELANELGSDLDNLIKPVIDTLFFSPPNCPPANPMPTGALFRTISDKRVFEIRATKVHAETEGTVITVSWN
jgi:hypothetical protein